MKTVAKRLLSLALGLCLAVAGVFTIAPTVTASAATETETLKIIATSGTFVSAAKTITWTGDNVQFKNEQGGNNNAIRTSDADHFRVYKSNKTTISTLDGSIIKKIVITGYGESKYITPISESMKSQATVTTSGSTVTAIVNAPSISFSATGQWRLNQIAITYAKADTGAPFIEVIGASTTKVGEEVQLTVNTEHVTDPVVWSSSDETIATVENGLVTAHGMGEVTITASANGAEGKAKINVWPLANSELTIAQAITVCEWTGETNTTDKYTTTGTIKSIDTAYDSGYGNITVTITDGTDSIKAFRMKGGSELKIGDLITVTGVLVNYYSNTPEFIAGCTYVKVTTINDINAYMQLAYKYTEDVVNEEVVLKDSDFRLNCGIDSTIADVEGATSYGIRVTANGKTKDYTSETATSWAEKDGKFYVVLSLGDIINDTAKLGTEFTVQAYAVVDDITYVSENTTTYSVATMVKEYMKKGYAVGHLYNYLVEKGLIVVEEVA